MSELAHLRHEVAQLKAEAEITRRLASYDDGGPQLERKYRFISSELGNFAVTSLCRATRVSRSAYYAWAAKADLPGAKVIEEAQLANLIWDIYWANRCRYGSPRVTAQLWRQGVKVNHKTVESLMAALGLQGLSGRRKLKTTRQDPAATPAPDLVQRNFKAGRPGQLFVGDITYIPTDQGFCFLATVVDVCSRALVGWSIQAHMRASLCTDALMAAVGVKGRLHLAGSTFHSDRGCQYTSDEFRKACKDLRITQSMGSVGDSYDNAMAESFFASLKRELVDVTHFTTIAEARQEVFDWVIWYNRQRLHSSLGHMTPEEFEERFNHHQAA